MKLSANVLSYGFPFLDMLIWIVLLETIYIIFRCIMDTLTRMINETLFDSVYRFFNALARAFMTS